jgi:hypothetical protein
MLVSIAFTASKGIDSLLICRSIVIRLVLQLVLICQQGNIESPSTISGRFFKACVVLYNLQALAHLVGTIGFWKMFYLLPDYWKWRLAPLRREEGLRKIQEREKILQQRELDAAAIPVGPIVNMLQYTAGPVPVDEVST